MSVDWHIREARLDDCDAILKLITELAIYEKAEDLVKATPEMLKINIFEKKHAHALMAFLGTLDAPREPIGLALYFFNFSTWTGRPGLYLEDLYVTPEHRGGGLGKAFFGYLSRVAKKNDCARLDWAVLKWNAPSIAFYEKTLNATRMEEWEGMRLDESGINALEKFVSEN